MKNSHPPNTYTSQLAEVVPQELTDLIGIKGAEVVERIGVDTVKEVIADVLCGKNLRNSTEMLTRRRLGMMNAATLVMFFRGVQKYGEFLAMLPDMAAKGLKETKSKPERWLLQWIVGLTTKGVQNVLRDSHEALDAYIAKFKETSEDIVRRCKKQFGDIAASIQLENGARVRVSWEFFIALFCAVGSQTLAIRGSEKSTYGKLFERLVLGSVLSILGFKLVPREDIPKDPKMVFWLSSQFGARESDATLILAHGEAVRFDLGFIGRGNPEISKDKVSRFERQLEIHEKVHYSSTFVIVDRVGDKSKIVDQAKKIGGVIIQMSHSQWPQGLAKELNRRHGFSHELLKLEEHQADDYIRGKIKELNVTQFVSAISQLITDEEDEPGQEEAGE